eukprot:161286_1
MVQLLRLPVDDGFLERHRLHDSVFCSDLLVLVGDEGRGQEEPPLHHRQSHLVDPPVPSGYTRCGVVHHRGSSVPALATHPHGEEAARGWGGREARQDPGRSGQLFVGMHREGCQVHQPPRLHHVGHSG